MTHIVRYQGILAVLAVATLFSPPARAEDVVYEPGVSPECRGCRFGDFQVGGETPSVAVGGHGFSDDGDRLNGQRTYMWDRGAAGDLADGVANRGDPGFAMMIWDFDIPLNTIRLYTHLDHHSGGKVSSDYEAQDLMEYSVWGSQDGDHFVLLSDVVAHDINGGGPGLPTYTFVGTAPSVVFRGGSKENGIINGYTRDYTFETAYRYYGIRTSSLSLQYSDADPELDAVAAHAGPIAQVAPPSPADDAESRAWRVGAAGGWEAARRLRDAKSPRSNGSIRPVKL